MGRTVKDPCNYVISFRVNEEERHILDRWSSSTGLKVSTMMREIIHKIDDDFCETTLVHKPNVPIAESAVAESFENEV